MVTKAMGPSRSTLDRSGDGCSAARRAVNSQQMVSTPNTASAYNPLHLVPHASPSKMPAASRHGRQANSGVRSAPESAQSAYIARARSLSTSRQANAAATNIARMPSRIAVLLSVIDIPSTASSNPAVVPRRVDRNNRRPALATITTVTIPATAVASRHPAGSIPSSRMPSAMSHLPMVGWTTNEGWSVKTSRSPSMILSSAPSTKERASPNRSNE